MNELKREIDKYNAERARMKEQEEIIGKQKHAIVENCELRRKIEMLKKELEFANNEATFWRLRAEQENELYVDLQFRYRIMSAPSGEKRAVQKEYMDHLDMVKAKKEQKQ